jgi:hypothetical protein
MCARWRRSRGHHIQTVGGRNGFAAVGRHKQLPILVASVYGIIGNERIRLSRGCDIRIDAQELSARWVVVAADYGVSLDAKIGGATTDTSPWRGVVGATL